MKAVGCCVGGKGGDGYTHGLGTVGFLANVGYLLFSLSFPILLPLLVEGPELIALIPGMPLVVRFGVVLGAPSALLCGGASGGPGRWWGCFAFDAGGCRCIGFVVVHLGGDVHEPLVAVVIGQAVLCHQIVLDVGH